MFPCARGFPVEAAVQPPLALWRRRLPAAVLKFSQATSRLAGPLQPPSLTSRAPAAKLRERSRAASAPSLNTQPSTLNSVRERSLAGFTLLELLIVMGIIAVLMVLVAPAFTNLKSAGDVTGAAYTIKGVLDQARTYAMANNTYTWVGFYEEDVSQPSTNPPTPGTGRLVMSVVASKDGTTVYNPNSATNPDPINPTKLSQIGKLVKLDNVHLPLFAIGSGTGETFDTRPALQNDPVAVYNYSRFGEVNAAVPNTAPYTNSQFPFQYPVGNPAPAAQYTFRKTLQFSPTGECRINSTYNIRTVIEIGLLQTHGTATPVPTSGAGTSTVTFAGNVAAIQITGIGSNVKIYRR